MVELEDRRTERSLTRYLERDNRSIVQRLKRILATTDIFDHILPAWLVIQLTTASAKGLAGDTSCMAIGLADGNSSEIGINVDSTFRAYRPRAQRTDSGP